MNDVILILLPALIGSLTAFIIIYLRDILLYKKQREENIEREIASKRLEKLYSRLYRNIISSKIVLNKETISYSKGSEEKGSGKELDTIKATIDKGFYLASEELRPYLAEFYKSSTMSKEKVNKMVELIKSDYNNLEKIYYHK